MFLYFYTYINEIMFLVLPHLINKQLFLPN